MNHLRRQRILVPVKILTPMDQKFATLSDLASHYRIFINRIQTQLSTMGGGGAGFIKDLDDVDITGLVTDIFFNIMPLILNGKQLQTWDGVGELGSPMMWVYQPELLVLAQLGEQNILICCW